MPIATSLDILIESARNTLDGEARRLAEDLGNARAAQERLALLESFRHDYEGRFRERAALGFSAEAWRNYRHFLSQLDRAIDAQRAELAERRRAADRRRTAYASAGQRLRSFETLAERRGDQARAAEERQEQRASDERSARRGARPLGLES